MRSRRRASRVMCAKHMNCACRVGEIGNQSPQGDSSPASSFTRSVNLVSAHHFSSLHGHKWNICFLSELKISLLTMCQQLGSQSNLHVEDGKDLD